MSKKDIETIIFNMEAFEIVDIVEQQSHKKLSDLVRVSSVRLENSNKKKERPFVYKGE